jgi:hypothetical protein
LSQVIPSKHISQLDIKGDLKVRAGRLFAFLLQAFLFLYLPAVYDEVVYAMFRYRGFVDIYSAERHYMAIAIFFLLNAMMLWKDKDSFTYGLNNLLLLLITTPHLIFFYKADLPHGMILCLVLMHFLISGTHNLKITLWKKKMSPKAFERFLYLSLTFSTVLFVLNYGFELNFKNLLFQEIYDTRFESRDQGNMVTRYLFSPFTKVLLPLGVVYFHRRKNWPGLSILIVVFLYMFLVGAHKSVIFSLIVALGFSWYKSDYDFKVTLLLIGVTIIAIIGFLEREFLDTAILDSMVFRRGFYLPAQLTKVYIETFENNHLYYGHSFLGSIFDYPFSMQPSRVVGSLFYDDIKIGANTGFIGDGYMNLGYFGTLLNSIFIVIIFIIFRSKLLPKEYFGLYLINVITLLNSSLTTTLLTHGLLFFIFIIQLYPHRMRDGKELAN